MSDENQNDPAERGPDGSPPGHIEKMTGRKPGEPKDDNTADPAGSDGQVAERPDNIPEKFWDAEKGEVNTEALLKAQADAEAALRKAQQGDDPDPKDGDDPDPTDQVTEDQAPVVQNASKEFAEKGELSADTYTKLESVGLTRDMVDTYIAGQQAIVSNLQSAAYEPFDGPEGYDKAANWAAENLDDEAIKKLDVQITSTNPDIVRQGAKALAKLYAENADVEPDPIRGGGNTTTGSVYRSRAEMIRDMSSPKYRTDAGFRKEVEEKLRRSKLGRS